MLIDPETIATAAADQSKKKKRLSFIYCLIRMLIVCVVIGLLRVFMTWILVEYHNRHPNMTVMARHRLYWTLDYIENPIPWFFIVFFILIINHKHESFVQNGKFMIFFNEPKFARQECNNKI